MRIVTLGTGHGDPTRTRCQSATLIQTNGRNYLVDCGEPANTSLLRSGVTASTLSGVFITHMHADHAGGLPVLLGQAGRYRTLFPTVCLQLLLPTESAVAPLTEWCAAMGAYPVPDKWSIQCYQAGHDIFDDGCLRISAFANRHLGAKKESYSLLVKAEGKRVFLSGDLSADFSDFPLEAFAGGAVDLTLCELTHYPLAAAESILRTLMTKRFFFTHIGDWYETTEGVVQREKFMGNLPYPAAVAYDNMEILL